MLVYGRNVAKEILNIKKFGITKEQFDSAKNNLINKIKMSFESTSYVSLFNAKNIDFELSMLTYFLLIILMCNNQYKCR